MSAVLARLHAALQAEGGLLAAAARPAPAGTPTPLGDRAAAGWTARGKADPEDAAYVVEAVHEGYLLHHGTGRVLDGGDADLALLAGDRLYALGLALLAERSELEAVAELAGVIALCSQAHAEDRPDLAEAAWEAGAAAVGWGGGASLDALRDRARGGDPSATSALREAVRQFEGVVAPWRSDDGPTRQTSP